VPGPGQHVPRALGAVGAQRPVQRQKFLIVVIKRPRYRNKDS
jgi:hypothetical protein